ncbi:ABC transporter permease [Mesorhizobium sp. NZP2298]|uniref:ABC transporter permease n=1 Tax=Mesorhizobium sp. NZP2298 TaxID=2483403 RepID=UPI001558025B|nr:ABC transporter permease [Mesorhizobium sp. NZP2298]QKC97385.1 ABC transporter permease [Mesorhizobium sp. NZP2298]
MRSTVIDLLKAIRAPVAAIALTLAIGFVLVAAITDEPVRAYRDLLLANFDSLGNFALFLNRATPLTLIALGVIFSFRAGVFNVGGEGQLYAGAITATVIGVSLSGLPTVVLFPLVVVGGILAGALLGWIPAVLKVRLAVDEVVTTLMLNIIVLLCTSYLANQIIRDPTSYGAVSALLPQKIWLPAFPGVPGATSGIIVAALLSVVSWVVLFRTEWGAQLRASGTNLRFARTIGVPADRRIVMAMLLAGGFGGLAGTLYVLGIGHRFEQNFSPNYGLVGLTCALLARIHPIGALATALFYAMIINGAAYMQISTDVPRSLVNLLTGLLVLLMTARLNARARG